MGGFDLKTAVQAVPKMVDDLTELAKMVRTTRQNDMSPTTNGQSNSKRRARRRSWRRVRS